MSFFEGAEKLLEVWFDGCGNDDDNDEHAADLRLIPRNVWDAILKLVKCEIISYKRFDELDAYVLSESSMFISRNRFIIKTCGTTSLLECLEPLLYVAKDVAGFEDVLDVFYSRKNFLRPELQPKPHSNFSLETETLDSFFEEGAAYCMGRMNRDHWYLYTMAPAIPSKGVTAPDQTLEVMMQDLDQKTMCIFTQAVCRSGPEATIKSGIDKLIPGAVIDEFLFKPCGYSMNGYIKGGYYMTIHITPEQGYSYVSFETNYPLSSYVDLLGRLLKTFNPGQFIVTLMTNETSIAGNSCKLDFKPDSYHEYQRKELQFARVKNYKLTYGLFAKAPS